MTNYLIHLGTFGCLPDETITISAESGIHAFDLLDKTIKDSVIFITSEDPDSDEFYSRYYLDNIEEFINPEILF